MESRLLDGSVIHDNTPDKSEPKEEPEAVPEPDPKAQEDSARVPWSYAPKFYTPEGEERRAVLHDDDRLEQNCGAANRRSASTDGMAA
jgi:hypothetical protein